MLRSLAPRIILLAGVFTPSRTVAQDVDAGEPLPTLRAPATPTANPTANPTPTPTADPTATPTPTEYLPDETALAPRTTRRHEGLYLRVLTGGLGYMSVWGDGPNGSASISGLASVGGIAIGATIAKGLALAGSIRGASTSAAFQGGPFVGATLTTRGGTSASASENARATVAEIGLLIDWYPDPASGWHAGASVGLGGLTVINEANNGGFVGLGVNGSLFGGYDWWVGRYWSVGLALAVSGGNTSAVNDANRDTGYRMMPLSIVVQPAILYY